jgi:hypothetical protein
VVEAALVRPQGEGDNAAEVTNHPRESNNNLGQSKLYKDTPESDDHITIQKKGNIPSKLWWKSN